jgi:hypothetical protein
MAEPPASGAAAEPGITITRVFDAPRERVWKEWTEPERFADWFGGGEAEVPVSTVLMDVREGARGGRRCSPAPAAARSTGRASTARWSRPSGWCSPSPTGPARTATSWWSWCSATWATAARDAVPAAWAHVGQAVRTRRGGWSSFFDRMGSTWPTPDPAGAFAYRVLDLDGTREGNETKER